MSERSNCPQPKSERRRIPDKLKPEIIVRLAQGMSCQQVATWLAEEHDFVIGRNAIRHYVPTSNPDLRDDWREKYFGEQARFRKALDEQPLSHQAERLAILYRQIRAAEERGTTQDGILVAQLVKTAAMEMGGRYLNRMEITGAGGAALIPEPIAETRDRLAEKLAARPEVLAALLAQLTTKKEE